MKRFAVWALVAGLCAGLAVLAHIGLQAGAGGSGGLAAYAQASCAYCH